MLFQKLKDIPSGILATKKRSNELSIFLVIFINFSYYICVSPFNVRKTFSEKDNRFQFSVTTWLPQVFICGSITFLSIFCYVGEIRQSFPQNHKNPSEYFNLGAAILGSLLKCFTIKVLWTNKHQIDSLINYLEDIRIPVKSKLSTHQRVMRKKFVSVSFCVVYYFLGLVTFIGTGWHPENFFVWDSTIFSNNLLKSGNFWYQFKPTNITDLNRFQDTDEILITIIAGISYYQRQNIGMFTNLILLVFVGTLWHTVCNFTSLYEIPNIENLKLIHTKYTWPILFSNYKKVKQIFEIGNRIIGGFITCYVAEAVVSYSTSFDDLFVQLTEQTVNFKRIIQAVRLLVLFSNACCVFLMCGDICHKV